MFQVGNPWARLATAIELKSHHGTGAMNVATDLAACPGARDVGQRLGKCPVARILRRKHSMKQEQQFWRKSESLGFDRHGVCVTPPEPESQMQPISAVRQLLCLCRVFTIHNVSLLMFLPPGLLKS